MSHRHITIPERSASTVSAQNHVEAVGGKAFFFKDRAGRSSAGVERRVKEIRCQLSDWVNDWFRALAMSAAGRLRAFVKSHRDSPDCSSRSS